MHTLLHTPLYPPTPPGNLLRERVVFLEEEYARVEGGMYAAKSEAFELQRRLDEVLVEVGCAGLLAGLLASCERCGAVRCGD